MEYVGEEGITIRILSKESKFTNKEELTLSVLPSTLFISRESESSLGASEITVKLNKVDKY